MKISKFLAAAAIVLAACGSPYRATDTATVYVAPDGIRTTFVTQYPAASNVVWSRYDPAIVSVVDWDLNGWQPLNESDYAVRFTLDNEDYYAWYDDNGDWVGTAYVISDYHLMPAAVNSTIRTQYPGYSITAVNKQFRGDMVCYEVELKTADMKVKLLLDGNGTVLKQRSKALY
jgi:hypothetical protein